MSNAKQKAQNAVEMLGVKLGPALEVKEVAHRDECECGGTTDKDRVGSVPSQVQLGSHSLHDRLAEATGVFVSEVEVTFESVPTRQHSSHHHHQRSYTKH